jgi:hypothetical protein
MIRKNISLYEKDLKKLAPLLEQHEGNLSAAIREMIEFVDFMHQKFGSLEAARRVEKRLQGICIPRLMLTWFLSCTDACLPTEESIDALEELIPLRGVMDLPALATLGFTVAITAEADDARSPTKATVRVGGEREQAEFVAKLAACYLGKQSGLRVEEVDRQAAMITLRLKKLGEPGSEAVYTAIRDSLLKHFGERDLLLQELRARPKFWNDVVTSSVEWSMLQRYRYPKLYGVSELK